MILLGLSTAVLLTACVGQAPALQSLASRLDGLPGVVSARAELAGGGVTPAEHRLWVVVDPGLREADARRIAEVSCEGEVEVSTMSVATNDDTSTPGTVLDVLTPESGTTCLSETGLVRLAGVSAAMQQLGADFDGRFSVSLLDPARDDEEELLISTSSVERGRLLDALDALRREFPDLALDYRATWDRDDGLPGTVHLAAVLSADADLAPLLPLVERAQELGTGTVAIEDDLVTIELLDETPVNATAELTALASQAGATLEVQPPLPATARPVAPWQ